MSGEAAVRRETIYGMEVDVVVCRPSRRRASSSVQRRRRKSRPRQGAIHAARERGLKTDGEE